MKKTYCVLSYGLEAEGMFRLKRGLSRNRAKKLARRLADNEPVPVLIGDKVFQVCCDSRVDSRYETGHDGLLSYNSRYIQRMGWSP